MTEKTIKASDICKIETMDYFEYKTQCKSSNPKPCLEDIEVTIPSNDCKVAGIKYRITWECSG
jgi:hypothetical protein